MHRAAGHDPRCFWCRRGEGGLDVPPPNALPRTRYRVLAPPEVVS